MDPPPTPATGVSWTQGCRGLRVGAGCASARRGVCGESPAGVPVLWGAQSPHPAVGPPAPKLACPQWRGIPGCGSSPACTVAGVLMVCSPLVCHPWGVLVLQRHQGLVRVASPMSCSSSIPRGGSPPASAIRASLQLTAPPGPGARSPRNCSTPRRLCFCTLGACSIPESR